MAYLNPADFSLYGSIFFDAVQRGYFSRFLDLKTSNVRKYLPKSESTTKGIMECTRKTENQQKGQTSKRI